MLAVYGMIVLTVAGFYKAAYQSLMEEVGGKARNLAVLIAINVDPEDVKKIYEPHDLETASFKRIHQYFESVKATQPDLKYIDIFRPPGESGHLAHWTFVVDLYPIDTDLNGNGIIEKDEEGVLPGRVYESNNPQDEKMWQAALYRPSTSTDHFWTDEWGTYISGMASIHDPVIQKPIAVLEVDIPAGKFAQKRKAVLIVSLAAGILLAIVTVALVALLRRTRALECIRTLTHNLYVWSYMEKME